MAWGGRVLRRYEVQASVCCGRQRHHGESVPGGQGELGHDGHAEAFMDHRQQGGCVADAPGRSQGEPGGVVQLVQQWLAAAV